MIQNLSKNGDTKMDKKAEVQEKIKNTQEKLREVGYFASMDLTKKVALFLKTLEQNRIRRFQFYFCKVNQARERLF